MIAHQYRNQLPQLRTRSGSKHIRNRSKAHRHNVRQLLRQGEQYHIPDRYILGHNL